MGLSDFIPRKKEWRRRRRRKRGEEEVDEKGEHGEEKVEPKVWDQMFPPDNGQQR